MSQSDVYQQEPVGEACGKYRKRRGKWRTQGGTYVENKRRDDEEDEDNDADDARQAQNSSSWTSENAKKKKPTQNWPVCQITTLNLVASQFHFFTTHGPYFYLINVIINIGLLLSSHAIPECLLFRRCQSHVQNVHLVFLLQLFLQRLFIRLVRHQFLFNIRTRPTSRSRRLSFVRPCETSQGTHLPSRRWADERGVHFPMRRKSRKLRRLIRRFDVGINQGRFSRVRRLGGICRGQRLEILLVTMIACTDGFHGVFDGCDGDL